MRSPIGSGHLLLGAVASAVALPIGFSAGPLPPEVPTFSDVIETPTGEFSRLVDEAQRRAWLLSEPAPGGVGLLSVWPVSGPVTSGFAGTRLHPVLGITRPHRGVDIAASPGTVVRAPAAGRIRDVAVRGQLGLTIELEFPGGLVFVLGHLGEAMSAAGDAVSAGQRIGRVGTTGLSSGPHLHVDAFVRGRRVDPLGLLPRPVATKP